jgi:hypothetical protein
MSREDDIHGERPAGGAITDSTCALSKFDGFRTRCVPQGVLHGVLQGVILQQACCA